MVYPQGAVCFPMLFPRSIADPFEPALSWGEPPLRELRA